MNDAPTKAGFVALIGEPNAGKSTLLQLMRELLFGFKPLQNPYVFDDHAGEQRGVSGSQATPDALDSVSGA